MNVNFGLFEPLSPDEVEAAFATNAGSDGGDAREGGGSEAAPTRGARRRKLPKRAKYAQLGVRALTALDEWSAQIAPGAP